MIFFKNLIFCFLFLSTLLFGQNSEVDNLLEKINHTNNSAKKQALLNSLKKKLAQSNKKAREEADAIIKAKEKLPSKTYSETSLDK